MFILGFISKSITQEMEEFELPKSTYYDWKKKFELWIKKGLVKKKPMARSHPKQLSLDTFDEILNQLGIEATKVGYHFVDYHQTLKSACLLSTVM